MKILSIGNSYSQDAHKLLATTSGDAALLYLLLMREATAVTPETLMRRLRWSELRLAAAETALQQQRMQNRLGQYQGRMEVLGSREGLLNQHGQILQRIGQLEDTYAALTIAQETLMEARAELQRRFAPRISQRAQELFARLTAGRYQRITLGQDMSLEAATQSETTMRNTLWRSDGTVDQLYLALRLAVAEELTPEAPLVLDDALVRFDDVRLKAALDILEETAVSKQVILFTCQGREQAMKP